MTSPDTFTLGPLGFATSIEELQRWFAGAAPGDEAVYASGFSCPREHASVVLARRWSDQGLAVVFQRRDRLDPRRWQYFIRKSALAAAACKPASRPGRAANAPGEKTPRRDLTREQMRFVLKRLREAAHDGDCCPSHGELAKLLCLRAGSQGVRRVRYLISRLELEKHIAVIPGGSTSRPVITILAPGRGRGCSTRPPAARPAREAV